MDYGSNGVSNPSRGTCAFGLTWLSSARGLEAWGLKPLSGNVCLRPDDPGLEGLRDALVSNPSRGTCAFGRRGLGSCSWGLRVVSNPSRGTCAFGPALQCTYQAIRRGVSNPSRGTCAFGLHHHIGRPP